MPTRHISFEHTDLAVHLEGRGPLAVLLHGFPLDARMWLDVLHGPLAESFTLAAIDLRGHGDSPWCGDAIHTMDAFADDVSAVIRTLSDDPVHVVGLSMGGYVALALHERHPALLASLTLADTRARADTDQERVGREQAAAALIDRGRFAFGTAMAERLLAPRPPDDPHGRMLRARLLTMVESQPLETILADLRGMGERPDRTESTSAAEIPLLLLAGEHDALTPPAESEALAASIHTARHVMIPGAGHLTPMENPVAFAEALGAFWG